MRRTPAQLLDSPATPWAGDGVEAAWFADVERSLSDDLEAWLHLVDRAGELHQDRAWRLLNFAEQAATQIVRDRRRSHLELAAAAVSLLEDGPLDRREAKLVGAVLHRGAGLAGIRFAVPVRVGCARVGERGARCLGWLERASGSVELTHVEHGSGPTFRFERRQRDIDVAALERWARGENT